ncbi:MAG: tRNA (cytosine(32)/uridine(32)-2'-O)-methyltransferase TrmJ, partial [Corallincola sp.]|nr:tRNA (cytosine(32)/uridine(32)-2'-O)-methyltransferase TrmJ [Corallincola sp.]
GLTNDELQKCHYHLHIPSNPDYSALNLAQAVQVVTYELRMAASAGLIMAEAEVDYPPAEELERFYAQLEQTLRQVGFILPRHPGQVMQKLRRLFTRARPETQEMAILRGMLATMYKASTPATSADSEE